MWSHNHLYETICSGFQPPFYDIGHKHPLCETRGGSAKFVFFHVSVVAWSLVVYGDRLFNHDTRSVGFIKVFDKQAESHSESPVKSDCLGRMAADDWESPHPCDDNPEELENIWNTHNCIWLTVGSIVQQGCDILPKAASTRIALSFWFFFALIIISSYTANLAAFLTMSRMGVTIESAEDLAKQTKIKYGAVLGGSTLQFFKDSNFSTYQR